jgi:hypothetical protein
MHLVKGRLQKGGGGGFVSMLVFHLPKEMTTDLEGIYYGTLRNEDITYFITVTV